VGRQLLALLLFMIRPNTKQPSDDNKYVLLISPTTSPAKATLPVGEVTAAEVAAALGRLAVHKYNQ